MNTGKETWKWGLVALLLAIFLITANQAYQHVANQEVYEAPDDWTKGDSWDLEHQSGPGAGQPMQMSTESNKNQNTPAVIESSNSDLGESLTSPEQIIIEENIDWNQSDSEQNNQSKAASESDTEKANTTTPKQENNQVQTGMYEIFTAPSVKETSTPASEPISVPAFVATPEPINETVNSTAGTEQVQEATTNDNRPESSAIPEITPSAPTDQLPSENSVISQPAASSSAAQ